ncbi:hypothetical protein L9F63_027194, partial [Diploptera punctata]
NMKLPLESQNGVEYATANYNCCMGNNLSTETYGPTVSENHLAIIIILIIIVIIIIIIHHWCQKQWEATTYNSL